LTESQGTSWIDAQQDATPKGKKSIIWNDQVKENKMGEACGMNGEKRKETNNVHLGSLKCWEVVE
jgi:hypothetical protein